MSLDPLAQLNLVTIGATVLIFLLTLLLLRRICFLPLLAVMERRAARVEAALARKLEADRLLDAARIEADRVLGAAREQAERLAARTREEAAQLRAERLAAARAEAEAIQTRGGEEVAALRQTEAARLEAELCGSVSRTLARIVGQVDESAVRFMVNRVLTAKEAG